MPGALRRDHEHVDVIRRNNLVEMDIEAVRKRERAAGLQMRRDLAAVERRLLLIRNEDHRDVRRFHGVRHGEYLQPVFLGDLRRF